MQKTKFGRFKGIEDAKVALLKKIIDFFDADIVLISSWKDGWLRGTENPEEIDRRKREYRAIRCMENKLDKQNLKVIDKTEERAWQFRDEGIHNWLDSHPSIEEYIILDDEDFHYTGCELGDHWIETDYEDSGLTEEHVEKAMCMIRDRKTRR